jgi:hypothetical protein
MPDARGSNRSSAALAAGPDPGHRIVANGVARHEAGQDAQGPRAGDPD